jgi:hypothetical protein
MKHRDSIEAAGEAELAALMRQRESTGRPLGDKSLGQSGGLLGLWDWDLGEDCFFGQVFGGFGEDLALG